MINNSKTLANASSFFDGETDEFKRELKVESILVDIACEFIKYRSEMDMSQKELAQKLQITQAMVSKLESGDYNPTVKMLFEIAQKLSWDFRIIFHHNPQKSGCDGRNTEQA